MRTLQRLHQGKLDVVWDQLEGRSFYSDIRARFRTDALYPAYELMYPRDEKVITREILDITGLVGITSFFIDAGKISGKRIQFFTRNDEATILEGYLNDMGYPSSLNKTPKFPDMCFLRGANALKLAKDMRQITHRSMRHKVDAFIHKYEPIKPRTMSAIGKP